MKSIPSTVTISIASALGLFLFSPASISALHVDETHQANKQTDELVELCRSAGDSDARFRCLLDQGSRVNQAKNFARQRGEQENGGVSVIEVEPSMHGPSAKAPYSISTSGDVIEYTFTFRLRPRGTTDYTQEAEVLVTFDQATDAWEIETLSNEPIDPTPCSFASELQDECS